MQIHELKHSAAYSLWTVSGTYIPSLLLTALWIVGADTAAGEKGGVGVILAGAGWNRAFLGWMRAPKTPSKASQSPDCARNYRAAPAPWQTVTWSICCLGDQLDWKGQSVWRIISVQFLKQSRVWLTWKRSWPLICYLKFIFFFLCSSLTSWGAVKLDPFYIV